MKRKLNEQEVEEVESIGHFIKYLLSKPNAQDHELWEGMMKMEAHARKMIIENIDENAYTGLIDLDDMKELVSRMVERIVEHISKESDD